MALTNPWLADPMPTEQLPTDVLEERILQLLSTHNMCVLATCGPDGPLATPVRYFHLGFSLMFTASGRSPKMRNIAADPRVSIGVHAPLLRTLAPPRRLRRPAVLDGPVRRCCVGSTCQILGMSRLDDYVPARIGVGWE